MPLAEDRGHDRVARVAEPTEDPVDQRLVIDGVAEGIAERRVLERLRRGPATGDGLAGSGAVRVERELRPAVGGADDRLDVGLALEGLELLGVRVAGIVELA